MRRTEKFLNLRASNYRFLKLLAISLNGCSELIALNKPERDQSSDLDAATFFLAEIVKPADLIEFP